MTKFIAINQIASVGVRRNVRTIFTKDGASIAVSEAKVVDERGIGLSTLRGHGLVGDYAMLTSDDVIVTYDSGRTYRRPVPAGTELFRTSAGAPAYAGYVAARFPGFEERLAAIPGAKHLA